MNGKKATPPCKCGYLGHHSGKCRCTPDQVALYRSRISGPLLDRIDIHVAVPALRDGDLIAATAGERSAAVRARVVRARALQLRRHAMPNARLHGGDLERRIGLHPGARAFLRNSMSRLALSARAHHRVLKVARTIADLEGDNRVGAEHVAEAIQYR